MKTIVALVSCLALLFSSQTANAGSNTIVTIDGPTTITTGEIIAYRVLQTSNSPQCMFGAMNLYILARTAFTQTSWEADRVGMSFELSATKPGTMSVWASAYGEDGCQRSGWIDWEWVTYTSEPFTITVEGNPITPVPTVTPTPTFTPEATATPTATAMPSATPTPTATPESRRTCYMPLVWSP